jgi:hypothetical protein
MPSKSYTLVPYHLRDHKVQSKKKVFSSVPERYSSVLEAKKTIFGLRYGLPDFTFSFLVELGTCVQNLIFTKVAKKIIFRKGVAEIHIQRPFFDNKNSIRKILGLKIQTVETCSSGLLYT